MTTPAPDSEEARDALRAVRQQETTLIRRSLPKAPAWYWLAGASMFVLLGLAWDLLTKAPWAVALVCVVGVAALITLGRVSERRWGRMSVRPVWLLRRYDNRTYWIQILWIALVVWTLQQTSDEFSRMGLTWPHTLGGCAAAVVFLVAGPVGTALVRRRLIARVESGSGSDAKLRGLPRVLSLMPVYEAWERRQRERAERAEGHTS